MTCSFTPFGGGSRVVSLWDMLRFHADKFVDVFNTLKLVEDMLTTPESPLKNEGTLSFIEDEVKKLHEQLLELNLNLSAKEASRLRFGLTNISLDEPEVWSGYFKKHSEQLRVIVADELEGKAIYYVSDHVNLLSDSPLFGDKVDGAFPSAQYDISEAGRCLALRRSTACVVHLMRALEVALASLANVLGRSMTTQTWNTTLNVLETEIRSRDKKTLGEKWREEDEQFFAEAATHFRLIKNAWRNHAAHAKAKYTDEEAKKSTAASVPSCAT